MVVHVPVLLILALFFLFYFSSLHFFTPSLLRSSSFPPPSFLPSFLLLFTTPSLLLFPLTYQIVPFLSQYPVHFLFIFFFLQIPRYEPPNYFAPPTAHLLVDSLYSTSTFRSDSRIPPSLHPSISFYLVCVSNYSQCTQLSGGPGSILVSVCLLLHDRRQTTIDNDFFFLLQSSVPSHNSIDSFSPHDLIEYCITRAVVYIYPHRFLSCFIPWVPSRFHSVATFSVFSTTRPFFAPLPARISHLISTSTFNFSATCPPYTLSLHNDSLAITNTSTTLTTPSKHPLKVPHPS